MDERILTVNGERDNDNPLATELERHINPQSPGPVHLKLDLQNVPYITSVEIGTLVALHKAALACNGKLTLINVGENVQEVLGVCKLDKYLNVT